MNRSCVYVNFYVDQNSFFVTKITIIFNEKCTTLKANFFVIARKTQQNVLLQLKTYNCSF